MDPLYILNRHMVACLLRYGASEEQIAKWLAESELLLENESLEERIKKIIDDARSILWLY